MMKNRPSIVPLYLIAVFLLLCIGIGVTGYLYYESQRNAMKGATYDDISTVASLKVNEISRWRGDCIRDAETMMRNVMIVPRIRQLLGNPTASGLRRDVGDWMSSLRNSYNYRAVLLLDEKGSVRLSVPAERGTVGPHETVLSGEALRMKRVIFSDLHRPEAGNDIDIDILIPLVENRKESGSPVGVLLLRIDPHEFLYPQIQSWPTAAKTAETLLVRREKSEVVYLNELRHRRDAALSLRSPLSDHRLPAVMAAIGHEGIVEGIDYRGVPVLAAVRAVPDSPWFLVAKVDTEELYAPIRERFWLVTVLVGLLIVGAGAGVTSFWLEQHKQLHREQHESERQHHALVQRYDHLTRHANDIILLTDDNGSIVEVNDRGLAAYGYPLDEMLRMNLRDIQSPGAVSVCDQGTGCTALNGVLSEMVHHRKDGRAFPVEVSSRAVSVEEGRYYLHIIRDITERRQAEETLRESEARFRELAELLPQTVFETDAKGNLTFTNSNAFATYGYTRDDFERGFNVLETIVPDDRAKARENIARVMEGQDSRGNEYTALRRDGSTFPVLIYSGRIVRDDGPVGLRGIVIDITEHKRLERQFRQAQKMEAVGQLAGGIAHDFNNILTAITGYGHLVLMKMDKHCPLRQNVEAIIGSSGRAADLTQSLLTFSRKQMISLEPINLNDLISHVRSFLSRIIGEDISLETELSDRNPYVLADALQIEQLLMNLATNARDAMPGGGIVSIATDLVQLDHDFIKTHGYGKEGTYALISFSDNGEGMDGQTRERIFDPFFTTKEVGKGTGLGLATAYGMIKQHNGYINCYSELGKGTTFRIYLPMAETTTAKETSPVQSLTRDRVLPQGTETILLVEDEADVRMLTSEVLKDFGYRVVEAGDGEEALEVFGRYKAEIQLLILDVIMPKKNGKEVYEAIRRVRPEIKVIFASGYASDIIQKTGVLEREWELLSKPFSPQELLRKVREELDKRSPLAFPK